MFDSSKPGNVEDIFSGTADDAAKAVPPPAGPSPMLDAGTHAGKRLILVLAVVLLLALAGGAAYWYFRISRAARPIAPAVVDQETPSAPAAVAPQAPAEIPSTPPPAAEAPPVQETAPAPVVPVPVADADRDGLTDVEEAALGTDSQSVDTDADGLFDYEEVNTYRTDPVRADSDGDGYSDGIEIKNGYNPNGPGVLQAIP